MSSYIYPIKLQAQIVYPDVNPIISQSKTALESSFYSLPAINELLLQKMIEGALPSDNPFSVALGFDLSEGLFNNNDLDKRIYEFKKDYDSILVAEGSLSFEVPELRGILSKEIDFVIKEGLPILSKPDQQEQVESIVDIAEEWLTYSQSQSSLSGYDSRMGDLALAGQIAETIGPRLLSKDVIGDDKLLQTLQLVSPFIKVAIAVVLQAATGLVNIVSAAMLGLSVASAAANVAAAIGAVAVAATTAAIPAVALSIALFAFSQIAMHIYQQAKQWRIYLKELRRSRDQMKKTFAELVVKMQDEIAIQNRNIDQTMTRYRLVMAEMIARTLNGEIVIGAYTKDEKGAMILNFSVEEKFVAPDKENAITNTESPFLPLLLVGAALAVRLR